MTAEASNRPPRESFSSSAEMQAPRVYLRNAPSEPMQPSRPGERERPDGKRSPTIPAITPVIMCTTDDAIRQEEAGVTACPPPKEGMPD